MKRNQGFGAVGKAPKRHVLLKYYELLYSKIETRLFKKQYNDNHFSLKINSMTTLRSKYALDELRVQIMTLRETML